MSVDLERLERLRDEIQALRSAYGCKPSKYSSAKIARQAVEDDGFQAFILIGGRVTESQRTR